MTINSVASARVATILAPENLLIVDSFGLTIAGRLLMISINTGTDVHSIDKNICVTIGKADTATKLSIDGINVPMISDSSKKMVEYFVALFGSTRTINKLMSVKIR
jgi:hypothetical protein